MGIDTSNLIHKFTRTMAVTMLALSGGAAMAQTFPPTLSNTATVTAPANIIDNGNKTATDTNTLAL